MNIEDAIRECEWCGEQFLVNKPTQRFCDEHCRRKAEKKRYYERVNRPNKEFDRNKRVKLPREFLDKYVCYFLLKDGKIVYIGSSCNVLQRISSWQLKIDFDEVLVQSFHTKEEMLGVEASLIAKFKPPHNSNHNDSHTHGGDT